MDLQSSLEFDPSTLSVLRFAGFLLPTEEYRTMVVNFPGTNCVHQFAERGNFFHTYHLYENGKHTVSGHSYHCSESGEIEFNFDDLAQAAGRALSGVIIAEFHHTKEVPAELYLSHIHAKLGSYMAYPALPFMGDTIYTDIHAQQLENTLFWPGMINSKEVELWIAVVNPYKVSFSYQLSIFLPTGERVQSDSYRITPYTCKFQRIKDEFPIATELSESGAASASLCIAAQYKLVAYVIFRDVRTGVYTAIDHLHRYCLY